MIDRLNHTNRNYYELILHLLEGLMDRIARPAEERLRFLSALILLLSQCACLSMEGPVDRAEDKEEAIPEITVPLTDLGRLMPEFISLFRNNLQLNENRLIWTVGHSRLILDPTPGESLETYQVRNSRGLWIDLVRGGEIGAGCEKVIYSSKRQQGKPAIPAFHSLKISAKPDSSPILILRHESHNFILEKKISKSEAGGLFSFSIFLEPRPAVEVHSLESVYSFAPASGRNPPDFVWTPCLRPDAADLIADHSFRSPAVIIQKDANTCSLIPDLACLMTRKRKPSALDLDCTQEDHPRLSFGLCPWVPRGQVYYCRDPASSLNSQTIKLEYGYHLSLQTDDPPRMGFRKTVRLLWKLYGKSGKDISRPFAGKALSAWESDFFENKIPRSFIPLDTHRSRMGLFESGRLHGADSQTVHDAWFNAWYQSIRTAYGVYLEGFRRNDGDLIAMSHAVVDLLLSAPRREGLFPTVLGLTEESRSREWKSDSEWAGYSECYHILDCAWTGYWLLRYAEKEESYSNKIFSFLEPFAEFLMKNQLSNGAIPSFYKSITLEPRDELNGFYSAETSGSALFLAKYANLTQNRDALACSCKAMTFMAQHVIPTHRWFDFENFLSSSRKPFDFHDRYTLQFPQSTLCMIFSCHAFLELYRSTGDKRFEHWGVRVLDYLSLYQQVWSPPFLSRSLFGGFGVQNTDAEWSDARGALVSVLYYEYFKDTGREEYLERASAALQSAFSVSPHLSWGRFGEDRPSGSATCVHWGQGTAVTSAAILRDEFGDLFIDIENSVAHSLDGYDVNNLIIDKYTVSLEVDPSSLSFSRRSLKVNFLNCRHGAYSLAINGIDHGTFSTAELVSGILVDTSATRH